MQSKPMSFSNFSRANHAHSTCYRPENAQQMASLMTQSNMLARGNGLSYNDSCLNDGAIIIDTSRLTHLLAFDEQTGVLTCQPSASFACLFLVHPDFIPPVIPGTLHATIGGGIAHDIHGKNNHEAATLGHHIQWLDLMVGQKILHCTRTQHADLFHATLAGLGLTGIIIRVGITLKKAPRFVNVITERYTQWSQLIQKMQENIADVAYQVAWLDLIHSQKSRLYKATYTAEPPIVKNKRIRRVPPLPFRLITPTSISLFNRLYFNLPLKKSHLSLQHFNNPLDSVQQWTNLYGKKGLVQFQAVFPVNDAESLLRQFILIIKQTGATPTLSVLKYFSKPGLGMLSFVQQGITIAIDFINTPQAQSAILRMNALITESQGRCYLAKDINLTAEQFLKQYPAAQDFSACLTRYHCDMRSTLGQRLGLCL